jgi:hypothetical protein
MGGDVPPLPNTPSWRGDQSGGAQGQLYFLLISSTNLAFCTYEVQVPAIKELFYNVNRYPNPPF